MKHAYLREKMQYSKPELIKMMERHIKILDENRKAINKFPVFSDAKKEALNKLDEELSMMAQIVKILENNQ